MRAVNGLWRSMQSSTASLSEEEARELDEEASHLFATVVPGRGHGARPGAEEETLSLQACQI